MARHSLEIILTDEIFFKKHSQAYSLLVFLNNVVLRGKSSQSLSKASK